MNKSIAMLVLGGVLLPVTSLAGVREEMAKHNVKMKLDEAQEAIYQPHQTKYYEFNQPTKEWKFLRQADHSYLVGAILKEDVSYNPAFPEKTKVSYSYNDDGSIKEKTERYAEDGINYQNVSKLVYEYDDVTGTLLNMINHIWNSKTESWEVVPYTTRLRIIRDENTGFVKQHLNESFIDGKWVSSLRNDFIYTEGKQGATEVIPYSFDPTTQTWERQQAAFMNIEWERTDGQYVTTFSNYTIGDNLVKSLEQEDEKNGTLLINNSYTEKGYQTTTSYKESGAKINSTSYSKEDNGDYTMLTQYFDEQGNVASIYNQNVVYTDHGDISTYTELTGASLETATIFSKWKYEYKFDNDGNMTEMASYRLDTTTDTPDVYIPVEKEEYLNYFNAASAVEEVENIAAPSFKVSKEAVAVAAQGNICVKVFNLNGACVAAAQADGRVEVSTVALPAGVYVVDIVTENGHVAHKFVK